ncbi:DUF1178 family protein [Maritalea sp.]|uniref:DUF1178 family protein n=1 Tax=Maritalea sp. TaxID=2003361 RepID=UPI0039E2FE2F
MIQYSLSCANEHKFEAWFKNADAYDVQASQGVLECPVCGSGDVNKALMTPAVGKKTNQKVALSAGHPDQKALREAMNKLRSKVVNEAEYVGDRFAEEARKIHLEEKESRGIYGEATSEEVTGLVEDGIDFLPLPAAPEDHN